MEFIKAHSARILAVVSAALALVVYYVPDLPDALIYAFAVALLGGGEVTQRVVVPARRNIPPLDF
ncbi:hypothetical protein ACH427_03135 [Streptomyces sp. NPDC020379]|uniref:hypothetical protein n=1 Tax=Streptomyces sp. NPDC020379 TaxID=3365071 RepID=UPI0037A6D2D9